MKSPRLLVYRVAPSDRALKATCRRFVEFNPKTPKVKTGHSPVTQTESPAEYDLFVVNQKVPFLTLTITSENPWLVEPAHRSGNAFPVGMNAAMGRGKGIAEGDEIELKTPTGKKFRAIARLTAGIHPECLAAPAILGRWVTSNDSAPGQPVHFNSLLVYEIHFAVAITTIYKCIFSTIL